MPGLEREANFEQFRTPALGGYLTSIKVNGQWLTLGLTIDDLSGEDAETLQGRMIPIAAAVEAEIPVTDDAEGLRSVADGAGLEQQVCKGHVKRNTEALIEQLRGEIVSAADDSLAESGVRPQQALADLERLVEPIQTRRPRMATNWPRCICATAALLLLKLNTEPALTIVCDSSSWTVGTCGLA